MSDLIDGVAVEFFDIDCEIEKMKAQEAEENDIEALMDDDSGESSWLEREEQHYLNSFGD